MENTSKSSGASASFSSKALELAHGKIKTSKEVEKVFPPVKVDPVRKVDVSSDIVPKESALRVSSEGETLEISEQAKKLGPWDGAVATTVDAGAPKGSSKRLKSYGDAQISAPSKGSGFDSTV